MLLTKTQEVRRKLIYAEKSHIQRRRELGADFMRDIAVDFNEFWELDDEIPANYKKILVDENYDPLTDVEAAVCTLIICPGGGFSPYAEGVAFAFILAFETFLFVSCCYCLFMPFSEKLFEGCSEIQGACCGVIACRYCNFCLKEVLDCVADCRMCKKCNCCFPDRGDDPFDDPTLKGNKSPCRYCLKICSLDISTIFEDELPEWCKKWRDKFKVKSNDEDTPKTTSTAGEGKSNGKNTTKTTSTAGEKVKTPKKGDAQEEALSSQESDSEEEKIDSSEDNSSVGNILFRQDAEPMTLLYIPSENQSEVQMQAYLSPSKKKSKHKKKTRKNNLIEEEEEETDRTQNL